MQKGYVQVYTGDGKGKTTAAIGLAIRSLGAGKKVLFLQCMKGKAYSEQKVLARFAPQLTLEATGKPFFVAEEGMLSDEQIAEFGDEVEIFPPGKPPAEYKAMLARALDRAKEAVQSGVYDLVVVDELNVALFFGLIDEAAAKELLRLRRPDIELVLTGRNAPQWLLDEADLVTEMREVKHYYQKGVEARKGIED